MKKIFLVATLTLLSNLNLQAFYINASSPSECPSKCENGGSYYLNNYTTFRDWEGNTVYQCNCN